MKQVCAFHGLDESVLFLCVTLLDRYCASSEDSIVMYRQFMLHNRGRARQNSEECVDLGRAHRIVIAVFRIALKATVHVLFLNLDPEGSCP